MTIRVHRALVAALLAAALVLLAACGRKQTSEEAAAYAANVIFSNARLSAAENAASQSVHYLRMNVKNAGNRKVAHLEVIFYFLDAQGKVVLTERAVAVNPRYKPMEPGEARDFRQGFDPPADWNRVTPNVGIAYLEIK